MLSDDYTRCWQPTKCPMAHRCLRATPPMDKSEGAYASFDELVDIDRCRFFIDSGPDGGLVGDGR